MQKVNSNGNQAQKAAQVVHSNHKEFRRPIIDILEDLKRPVAKRFIKYKSIKGNRIEFISWYTLTRLLDYHAPGWDFQVDTSFDGRKVAVVGKLTIKAAEGDFTRCATGNENSDLDSWGDPYSNAEAQAFRRCCARFGLGLHLWEK